MTNEEIQRAFYSAASVVKLICGVANNAAWLVMMDAYDHAKQCRRFKVSVKGGHTVKWFFKNAINEWNDYERNLLRATTNRMFHLADMSEEVRRKYGDITDDEYYEFWKGIGGPAYTKTRPMITSLWNKYRLSLLKHDVKDAEHIAWVMTAQAAIDLAGTMYESALRECETGYHLPRKPLEQVFGQFSLKRLSKAWMRAMYMLAPETEDITPDPLDEKNIEMGLRQLMEAWMEPDLLYSSTSETVEDYDEIFRTKGFQKKVLREIADVRAETIKNLQEDG